MIPNAEMIQKINELRVKSLSGTMTKEEYAQAIIFLRGNRMASATATTEKSTAAKKAKKPTQSAADMLNELGL